MNAGFGCSACPSAPARGANWQTAGGANGAVCRSAFYGLPVCDYQAQDEVCWRPPLRTLCKLTHLICFVNVGMRRYSRLGCRCLNIRQNLIERLRRHPKVAAERIAESDNQD
jgi:hypothetical protein